MLEKLIENPVLESDKTYNKYFNRWNIHKEAHNGYAHYLSYELDCLIKINKRLRESLEFYANTRNWKKNTQLTFGLIDSSDQFDGNFKVGGMRARKALKEINE